MSGQLVCYWSRERIMPGEAVAWVKAAKAVCWMIWARMRDICSRAKSASSMRLRVASV